MMMYHTNYLKLLALGLISLSIGCSSDDSNTEDQGFNSKPNDPIEALIHPTSFYIVNEGWFGQEGGSINGIDPNLNVAYRLFKKANPDLELGVTTQFATAYGAHYFATSKQGNRLVMMDKNFKSKAILTDVGGDARSFAGIDENKAYVSTSKGVSVVSITGDQLSLKKVISGYSKQVGTLVYRNNLVYAATTDGLLIIDTKTDEIVATTSDVINQLTLDRQGNVWAATSNTLKKFDPALAVKNQIAEAIAYDISQAPMPSSAGAWNAGPLCASSKQDVLYWTSGKNVVSFNTATAALNSAFYELGTDAENVKLSFYGAALRVDPVTDDLIVMVKRENYGINGSYNWAQIVSNTGIKNKEVFIAGGTQNSLNGHYWFPAVPLFQDNNAPQIILNQLAVQAGKTKQINLDEIIMDQDSPQKLIEVTLEDIDAHFGTIALEKNQLHIQATGTVKETTFTVRANSNGKITKKKITLFVL